MPQVKSEVAMLLFGQGLGSISSRFNISVNTKGEFYCTVPEEVQEYFEVGRDYGPVRCRTNRLKKPTLFTEVMENLKPLIEKALSACHQPTIKEEHVISYNIESHVSFAVDENGDVFPNAGFPGAEWYKMLGVERSMYGNHNALERAQGGYSLTIGARALTKVTTTVGEKSKVNYRPYYKGAHHLGRNNPAQLLNSWTSFSLPKDAKEIPYSDEAAMFFYNLLFGIARLSKQIQEATFLQEDLLALIESSNGNLLGAPSQEVLTNGN